MSDQHVLNYAPAYSEDVIVDLIVQIYKLLILVAYLHTSEVIFAPPGGHAIDEAVLDELGLDSGVVSLMKRLPYFRNPRKGKPIFAIEAEPHTLSFLNANDVRASREPWDLWIQDPRDRTGTRLKPTELALVAGSSRDSSMILDVSDNVIRTVMEPADYRTSPAHSAPRVLGDYLRDLRALRYMANPTAPGISNMDRYTGSRTTADGGLEGDARVRRILLDDYGWGSDNFRAEDWKNDCENVWHENNPWRDPEFIQEMQKRADLELEAHRIRAGQPPSHPELR